MDVDEPAGPARTELGRQDAHEAGETDDIGPPAGEHVVHRGLEGGLAAVLPVRADGGGDPLAGRRCKACRIRIVREDPDDLGGIVRRLGGLDQRAHVGAAPGDQDRDALSWSRHRASLPSKVTGSPVRSVSLPMTAAFSPWASRCSTSRSASSGAMAQIMPTPQLNVRSISVSPIPPTRASQPKTLGTDTALRSMCAAMLSGSTRGMLSMKPPPVICARALIPIPALRALRIGFT